MRYLLIPIVLALSACAQFPSTPGYTLYLVRHAEKADDSDDPPLAAAGQARAAALADWLQDRDIRAIWSSNYQRTRQTVQPLAARLGQDVLTYDPGDASGTAARLRAAGTNALVAGHSNTIPELAAALCACAVAEIDDDEYDRLLVLRVKGDAVSLETLDQGELLSFRSGDEVTR